MPSAETENAREESAGAEETQDAGRFLKERFGPALEAVGFSGGAPQPQFWPVHSYMK